jgi:cysteinyl-tRNA synthetase
MTLRLFDTYTRRVRDFVPLHAPEVGLYTCGPTVYDYAHLGNLRTYLFEDLLRRVLAFNGYRVTHVMNLTDVGHLVSDADTGEDKMEQGSRRTGKSAWEIAAFYTQAFREDLGHLNILEPTMWCRATEHIPEQIDTIRCIEARGLTYRTADGIYFDTSQWPTYGELARLAIRGLHAGRRVEMGEKRHPTDFALWKLSPPEQKRQMEWDSPWGVGFPGWHVECSAMATTYLGRFFDMHCGGEDHIPVHHTNEIAQTEACHGTRLANFWLHGSFLQLDDAKMAKSTGDFVRLQTVVERGYEPLAYRLFCLSAHYRATLNFTWAGLAGAATALHRLRTAASAWGAPGTVDVGYVDRFSAQVNDDLNMPRALALSWELVRSALPAATKKATLVQFDRVFGLRLAEWHPGEAVVPEAIWGLVQQRQHARAEQRWQEADALREQVQAAGYDIDDTPQGPRLRSRRGRLEQ